MHLRKNVDSILDELQQYIIEGSTVFIAFSMGGGTGSAIGGQCWQESC